MPREYLKGEFEEQRGYSKAVKVRGGTTVYLAGVGATVDSAGRSLAGDFDAQTRASFDHLRANLAEAGGVLDDIVDMTVFITDIRFGSRVHAIRHEYFSRGFPTGALVGVEALANPSMMIELHAIAVVED